MQALGAKGEAGPERRRPCCNDWCSRSWPGIMWLAPIGAFGAIAGVVGNAGWAAIGALGLFVLTFYATCVSSSSSSSAACSRPPPGLSIFKVLYYLRQEYLLIVATSSSETALPRLIAKMEHLGRPRARRRDRRADRVLVQPRRHRDVPDHGVAVHRNALGCR